MRKGKGIVSLLLAVAILLSVITAAGTAAAEGLLAKEYTYHFHGSRYSPDSGTLWSIQVFTFGIAEEIPAIYQLIVEDFVDADGFMGLNPAYNYDWQLSAEAAAVLDLDWADKDDDRYYSAPVNPGMEEAALALTGKPVLTLNISRKSDSTVVTKVNCVLDSFVYEIEWDNHEHVEKEIVFTPGKPVTITLPQDKLASVYDGAKLVFLWERSLGDSYYTLESGVGLTSITFTPEADWDGNWVYVYVNRENIPEEEMASLNIDYMLKSDGTVPTPPDEPVTPGGSGTATNVPKTGDETPLATLGTLLLLSLLGVGALLLYRRRSA